LISLDFLNSKRSKTAAGFPHLDQRGKTRGNGFSASNLMLALVLAAGGFLATTAATAATAQTAAQQIDSAARNYLQQMMDSQAKTNGWQGMRLVIENTPLGSTSQLAPCPGQINVSGGSASKLARQQLTLECSGQAIKGWPVKVSSDLQVFLPVVISTGVIDRGATINASSLQQQETDITKSIRGFYHRIDQVAGMSAKRRIRTNQILSPDLIDQPQLVKRGEKVHIIANQDGIKAAMAGEALEKGGIGDVIRVKNISSGKTIEAKVVEAGVVTSTF